MMLRVSRPMPPPCCAAAVKSIPIRTLPPSRNTCHSMPLYVQIRLIPKFQNSTTMMAMALARL